VYTAHVSNGFTTCNADGVELTLVQTADTVAGTYTNGTITCDIRVGAGPAEPQGTVGAGSADGSNVAFILLPKSGQVITLSNNGSATLSSMSGTATVILPFGTDDILTGTWSATRN
jgi:hypothetical protein